ncbi:MAG: DMT family transporter [Alphaproteobacteria bacterium]|nr:DMT family transporter [Alphaproteobacteria bacterium]TAD92000.1 MAG: DMT family transporter [Alphaproteobacteria bacterium]
MSTGRLDSPMLGIGLMVLAVGVFSVMDGLVKLAINTGLTSVQVVFFRSLFGLLPVVAMAAMASNGLASLRPINTRAHALRAALNLASMLLFFTGVGMMPLADAIAIAFAAPLFLTILSIPLLGERVGLHRWAALAVGFSGVLVMTRPGEGGVDVAALLVLASAFTYALGLVLVRRLSAQETAVALAFSSALLPAVATGFAMPWLWVNPQSGWVWGLLVVIGLLGGCGQLLMINAFRRAEASLLAPFDYIALLWAAGIGIVLFGDWPGLNIWIGAAIVISAGLYILHREQQRRRG